jgi:membrane protein YqaA with SNARE-associated domain
MLDWVRESFLDITRWVEQIPVYFAAPMMVIIGALDSSLLTLPEVNDYITIARVADNPNEVYYFPLFPALGSLIGCLILYHIARRGEQFVNNKFHPRHLDRVKGLYRRWGLFALVIPAILPPPMPFKIFVATAGALNYPVARFAAVIMVARTARYYFWGILAYFFHKEVRQTIDWLGENLIEVLGVLLILGLLIFITRWLIYRSKSQAMKRKAQISYTAD